MKDDWTLIPMHEALAAIRGNDMKQLPFSCDRYKYFSTGKHPIVKHDSRKNRFYGNEDYLILVSN